MEKICGIYCIENSINHKKYIGQSVDINKRWKRHIAELNNNSHTNKHLQNAWRKYGQENFSFYIICECESILLNEKEIYYIKINNTTDIRYGYNATFGGNSGKRTDEAIEHNKKAQTGKTLSDSHKANISKGGRGLKRSEEARENIRQSKKRENLSIETIQKHIISMTGENNPMFGKHLSQEIKEKISQKIGGENHPFFGKFGAEASHVCCIRCKNTGVIFNAIILAQQWCGLKSASSISACLHGRQKTAGRHPITNEKLYWEFADDITNQCGSNEVAL